MEKLEIGRFYAITFDNQTTYEFIVYNDQTMDCPTLNVTNLNWINFKPRFEIAGEYYRYELNVYGKTRDLDPNKLIGNYAISDELLHYLKINGMAKYSTDMAYLYNFGDKDGYDHRENYGVRRPFKRAMKKGPILERQRMGIFN